MLTGITFWTDDEIWRGILTDLGASFVASDAADLIFNPKEYAGVMNLLELKSKIMADIDTLLTRAVHRTKGKNPNLSRYQAKIITLLERAGGAGVRADTLRAAMGYSPGVNTRALDTAIYNLRKIFGTDFIKTENGKYKLA
ncbi:MAG: hypothetical protein FWG80_00565 [Alphaproteobacteria bacterium]|nr:hypothetical protein [Alphaproteobacteria bacterium]